MVNNDQIIEIEAPESTPAPKRFAWLKDNAIAIGSAVGTLALTAVFYALDHGRNNRKEQAYYDYLGDKIELQREALGAYKDSIAPEYDDSGAVNMKNDKN